MTTLSTVPVKPVFAFFILLGIQLFVPNKVSAQCDQCIDDNIMVFDARVDVSQPVSDHDSINTWLGLFWTARVARYWSHYMDPNKDCFFWVDGGMYLANEYQGGTLRFDETYTNVPPPGPLTATPYLLTGSLTSAAGPKQYTFTWQLECGTNREVVKSASVVFTADSTGDVNIAGRTAASALQPLLRTIQDFEIQKREGDVGVARGGGGNTDAKITVTPARTQLDPNDTTDVELEMIDCDGYQLKNREIILEEFVDSTLGRFPGAVGGTISPTRVTTDVYGKAHVTFKAGAKSGVGIINAAYIFRKPHGWKYALTGNAVLNLAPNMWEVTASYEHIYTTTTDYTSTSTMDGVTTTQKGSSYWRASGRLHCVYENLNPQNAGFDTLVVYVFDNSQTTPDGITHGLSFQGNGVDMSTYREEIRDIKTGNLLGGDYSADQTSGTSGDSSSVYLYFSKEEIGFMDCFEMDASLHDIGWSASELSPLQSQISHNPINQWSKEIGGGTY
jgi:hypothetical protein